MTVHGVSVWHTMNTGRIGPDGMCYCDMWPEAHLPGTISEDGRTQCETLLTGPMLSPHLFPNARFANDPVE